MTAYDMPNKNTKNDKNVCRETRLSMGYSIAVMAQLLGIGKSTYQGYDQGTRSVPPEIVTAVKEAQAKEQAFFSRYQPGGEFDQQLNEMYPFGIISE